MKTTTKNVTYPLHMKESMKESWNVKDVFDYFFKDLEENCERYVECYEEKLKHKR